ncbi:MULTISPECIES: transcription elongation factor GreA [Kosmotoga]|uniref:Transcription elongation factor GreA n=1 Tax=Kosmotoga olearia (strain ATCC BAA-1733 / DSM 21960 / TBF 19.5.1) TaxID=521045 RepID=C5CHN4_KOSOT|nr:MULTISPECIES: transcription elongation factor GreA [Kosmotoga]ACR80710.1 transcription elongation factor GreA [Kosmotoga olearia TBF 19.5.1]MDI3524065.1 transcription elongation factor GreA [Kosmotoga sp.]MDK2953484.1 transcription elongation factor GreA [Kosmotoga sp.]OAA19156.1 transcription elongation factor GreA [Kosmotoga sp. DU53]
MSKKNVIYLTKEGYENLKNELNTLRKKLMYEVAERIKEARELGDLSENSEYDEAKNEQGKIDSRIKELEYILDNAEIIEDDGDNSVVKLGAKVRLRNLKTNEEIEIRIVNSQEADIFENKISADSPIGKAVLERSVDDEVVVRTPSGIIKYKIITISR